MSSTAALLKQRANGHVKLHMKAAGVAHLREVGSAKVRLPPGAHEAYLINTAGGLAGGDSFSYDVELGESSALSITSQAAERVYRTLGPPALIETTIKLEAASSLRWLPHETILFDGAFLDRRITIDMKDSARFLGLEATIFGREASGETINTVCFREDWQIKRDGRLIHADVIKLDPDLPKTKATLGNARAIATIILVAPNAEQFLDNLRQRIGSNGGVSAWNGKLVARLIANDGLNLKRTIVSALSVLASPMEMPKTWAV